MGPLLAHPQNRWLGTFLFSSCLLIIKILGYSGEPRWVIRRESLGGLCHLLRKCMRDSSCGLVHVGRGRGDDGVLLPYRSSC